VCKLEFGGKLRQTFYVKSWKVLETQTVLKNQWFDIKEQKVQITDAIAIEGVVVLHFPDWVNIVAMDDKKRVILERNYRHGFGQQMIETPSGTVEPTDSSPEGAARRELLEETGFTAKSFVYLGKSAANAQLQNNCIHHFLALGCKQTEKPKPEMDGTIETWSEPLNDVLAKIESGEISNSYIVEGLLRAQRHLSK
jgi:ADP-ribose pyrophosphatase